MRSSSPRRRQMPRTVRRRANGAAFWPQLLSVRGKAPMDESEMETLIRNVDARTRRIEERTTRIEERTTRIEQILPTLVTKEDAKAFLTKEDAQAFATKDDLKPFATKDDV